jgi:monoamine oxidase
MTLLEELPLQGPDLSYEQLHRQRWWRRLADQQVQRMALEFVEGFNAAPAREISVHSLATQTAAAAAIDGDRLFRVAGGYRRIVDVLVGRLGHAGGVVRLGATVERVLWRPGRVEVHARGTLGGRLDPAIAPAALVAIPVGVLKARPPATGAVAFSPALPADKREALRSMRMGRVVRAVLRFRRLPPAFTRRGLSFLHVSGGGFPTFWRVASDETPVVVGWAAGPRATRLPTATPARCLEVAVDSLARGLGTRREDLLRDLDAWRVFDWQQDPFARGAYTYVVPGALAAPARLAAAIAGTLFFAGEATHAAGASGTVHGALETGERAAREILAVTARARTST